MCCGGLGHYSAKYRCYERLLELSCGNYAAIFNDAGEILLMERVDGSGWCMPCGWVEPNERPVDTAVRETREETGLEVQVRRLVGVFSRGERHKWSV